MLMFHVLKVAVVWFAWRILMRFCGFILSIISGSVNSGSGLMLQSYQQKGRPVSLSSQPGSQCGDIHGSTHSECYHFCV